MGASSVRGGNGECPTEGGRSSGGGAAPWEPDESPQARPVQQGSAGSRRDDGRSPDALPEGALAAHPGGVARRDVCSPTDPTGRDPEAGREGDTPAGHPDGSG